MILICQFSPKFYLNLHNIQKIIKNILTNNHYVLDQIISFYLKMIPISLKLLIWIYLFNLQKVGFDV
jgi:hypothetical protein